MWYGSLYKSNGLNTLFEGEIQLSHNLATECTKFVYHIWGGRLWNGNKMWGTFFHLKKLYTIESEWQISKVF